MRLSYPAAATGDFAQEEPKFSISQHHGQKTEDKERPDVFYTSLKCLMMPGRRLYQCFLLYNHLSL